MKSKKQLKDKNFDVQGSALKVQGYTLIEVLMAVAIFFVLVAGPTGLFVSSLRAQTRILGLRGVIDNSIHVFEYISRALRMAKKELNDPPTCLFSHGLNYEKYDQSHIRNLQGVDYEGPGIKFINYRWDCQEIFLDKTTNHETKGQLMESKNGATPIPLTPNDLEVTLLEFRLSGQDQTDNLQPRVTMLFEITKKGVSGFPKMRTQTTISQRNLDITYEP